MLLRGGCQQPSRLGLVVFCPLTSSPSLLLTFSLTVIDLKFDDVDPAEAELDSIADGQLYRLRRDQSSGQSSNSMNRGRNGSNRGGRTSGPGRGGSSRGDFASRGHPRGGNGPSRKHSRFAATLSAVVPLAHIIYSFNSRETTTPRVLHNDARHSTNDPARLEHVLERLRAPPAPLAEAGSPAPRVPDVRPRGTASHRASPRGRSSRPVNAQSFTLASAEEFFTHLGNRSVQRRSAAPDTAVLAAQAEAVQGEPSAVILSVQQAAPSPSVTGREPASRTASPARVRLPSTIPGPAQRIMAAPEQHIQTTGVPKDNALASSRWAPQLQLPLTRVVTPPATATLAVPTSLVSQAGPSPAASTPVLSPQTLTSAAVPSPPLLSMIVPPPAVHLSTTPSSAVPSVATATAPDRTLTAVHSVRVKRDNSQWRPGTAVLFKNSNSDIYYTLRLGPPDDDNTVWMCEAVLDNAMFQLEGTLIVYQAAPVLDDKQYTWSINFKLPYVALGFAKFVLSERALRPAPPPFIESDDHSTSEPGKFVAEHNQGLPSDLSRVNASQPRSPSTQGSAGVRVFASASLPEDIPLSTVLTQVIAGNHQEELVSFGGESQEPEPARTQSGIYDLLEIDEGLGGMEFSQESKTVTAQQQVTVEKPSGTASAPANSSQQVEAAPDNTRVRYPMESLLGLRGNAVPVDLGEQPVRQQEFHPERRRVVGASPAPTAVTNKAAWQSLAGAGPEDATSQVAATQVITPHNTTPQVATPQVAASEVRCGLDTFTYSDNTAMIGNVNTEKSTLVKTASSALTTSGVASHNMTPSRPPPMAPATASTSQNPSNQAQRAGAAAWNHFSSGHPAALETSAVPATNMSKHRSTSSGLDGLNDKFQGLKLDYKAVNVKPLNLDLPKSVVQNKTIFEAGSAVTNEGLAAIKSPLIPSSPMSQTFMEKIKDGLTAAGSRLQSPASTVRASSQSASSVTAGPVTETGNEDVSAPAPPAQVQASVDNFTAAQLKQRGGLATSIHASNPETTARSSQAAKPPRRNMALPMNASAFFNGLSMPTGIISPPGYAHELGTVLVPDQVNGRWVEVTGLVKVGSIPLIGQVPKPGYFPDKGENTRPEGTLSQSFPARSDMHARHLSNESSESDKPFNPSAPTFRPSPHHGIQPASVNTTRAPLSPTRRGVNFQIGAQDRSNNDLARYGGSFW